MGSPAPSADALVEEPTALADTAAAPLSQTVAGFAVQNGELFLGENKHGRSDFLPLGQTTYVFESEEDASERTKVYQDAKVVSMTVTFSLTK